MVSYYVFVQCLSGSVSVLTGDFNNMTVIPGINNHKNVEAK